MQWLGAIRSRVQPLLHHEEESSSSVEKTQVHKLLRDASRCKRKVSRFWLEKLLVAVDGLQMYGIMWQMSQIWPWPSRWLASTRSTLIFSLDFFSLLPTGAGMGQDKPPFSHWGELDGYWVYALVFALLPYAALAAYWTLFLTWRSNGDAHFLSKTAYLENKLLLLFQVLYLPIGLAVCRLWNCQDTVNPLDVTEVISTMSVDPSFDCDGTPQILALSCITAALGAPFLVGFPFVLYKRIMIVGAYADKLKQERFVQTKELAYLVNLSDDYDTLYVAQYASFTRPMMTLPVQTCLVKLALLGIFSFGRSRYPSTESESYQGTCLCIVLLLFLGHRSLWSPSPFRCRSTAQLSLLIDVILAFDGIMVLLSANPTKSALTVASVKLALFNFVHTFAIIMICLWFVYTLALKQLGRLDWPTHLGMRQVVDHADGIAKWIAAVHSANSVVEKAFLSPAQVKPLEEMRAVLDALTECSSEAAKLDHLLHAPLHETQLMLQSLYVQDTATAVMASERIDDCVHEFTSELTRYQKKHQALAPHKRDALFKLSAMRTWQQSENRPASVMPDAAAPPEDAFVAMDVVVSTDWELNLIVDATRFATQLERNPMSTAPPLAVHWLVLMDDKATADFVFATAVQYAADGWLLVKLPLVKPDKTWIVVEGWIAVKSDAWTTSFQVELLACVDSDSRNLFRELMRPTARSPVDAKHIAGLLEATRQRRQPEDSLRQQWMVAIQQWNVQFASRHRRCPADADKAKIRVWYKMYHALCRRQWQKESQGV
ncbi:hypothetical protein Ae201684P_013997 [Aphanomyces euteiches]|nr:hypothetical protein Ae201684P_013997 [Aphanomyces euteiches]